MWAKSHPDVASAVQLWNGGKAMTKPQKDRPSPHSTSAEDPKPECVSHRSKTAIGPTRKCVTTNNKTIRETITDTTATPSPLPAGGQAPALLADREEQA